MLSLREMWHEKRNPPPDPTSVSYKNKTVVVTGANSGLGHQAAIKYAALGANPLILATRTQEKGDKAKESIIQHTRCPPDSILVETLELESFASVKAFAERVIKRVEALHVVQLAAGLLTPRFAKTADGFERTLQVNVLSPALLALLLLPKVRATPVVDGFHPCISFLISSACLDVKADDFPPGRPIIELLNDESKFEPLRLYFTLKLVAWWTIQGIAQQCDEDGGVVINCTHSGLCKTNLGRNFPAHMRYGLAAQNFIFARTAEEGARTLVSATGRGPESQGKLLYNDKYHPMSDFINSEEGSKMYKEVWAEVWTILRPHIEQATN